VVTSFYALYIRPAASVLGKIFRRISRKLRNRTNIHEQSTRLPTISWRELSSFGFPGKLVETDKRNGNVSLQELAVLSGLAAGVRSGTIIEIGTFDGRTTLNMALNSGDGVSIFTLDLPSDMATAMDVDEGETAFINKPASGTRFTGEPGASSPQCKKITQLLGDSATFDWSPYHEKAALIFVDGSHAYEYAKADSESSLKMLAKSGTIIWHDYGVWEGVTQALEELQANSDISLHHVRGTSLVVHQDSTAA
jgi:hypothetical protein